MLFFFRLVHENKIESPSVFNYFKDYSCSFIVSQLQRER